MSELLTGGINVTKLLEALRKGHSAGFKSEKTGDVWANVKVWVNDKPDQYENDASVQLNSKKDKDAEDLEKAGKGYLGNLKRQARKESAPVKEQDMENFTTDDLPF